MIGGLAAQAARDRGWPAIGCDEEYYVDPDGRRRYDGSGVIGLAGAETAPVDGTPSQVEQLVRAGAACVDADIRSLRVDRPLGHLTVTIAAVVDNPRKFMENLYGNEGAIVSGLEGTEANPNPLVEGTFLEIRDRRGRFVSTQAFAFRVGAGSGSYNPLFGTPPRYGPLPECAPGYGGSERGAVATAAAAAVCRQRGVPPPRRRFWSITAIDGTSESDVWAAGFFGDRYAAARWDGRGWRMIDLPLGGSSHAVSAVAPDNVWLLGRDYERSEPQTLHWDGSTWTRRPAVATARGYETLWALLALSESDVWAVGHRWDDSGVARTLAEHWDGKRWRVVPTPNVGPGSNFLVAVHGTAADDVWAVGLYVDEAQATRPLALHWNGRSWSSTATPPVAAALGPGFRDVVATGPGDVWAVGVEAPPAAVAGGRLGRGFVARWDGRRWTVVRRLRSVELNEAAGAPDDLWVAGRRTDTVSDTTVAHAERWDGASWQAAPPIHGAGPDGTISDLAYLGNGIVWAAGGRRVEDRTEAFLSRLACGA